MRRIVAAVIAVPVLLGTLALPAHAASIPQSPSTATKAMSPSDTGGGPRGLTVRVGFVGRLVATT